LDALVVDDEEVVEAGFQLSLGEGRHLFDVLADEGLDGLDGDAARGFFLGAGPGRQHVVVGDQEIGSQALLDIFPAPFVDLIHRRHGDVEGGVSDHEIAGAPELLVGGAVALVWDVEVREAEGELGADQILRHLSGLPALLGLGEDLAREVAGGRRRIERISARL